MSAYSSKLRFINYYITIPTGRLAYTTLPTEQCGYSAGSYWSLRDVRQNADLNDE